MSSALDDTEALVLLGAAGLVVYFLYQGGLLGGSSYGVNAPDSQCTGIWDSFLNDIGVSSCSGSASGSGASASSSSASPSEGLTDTSSWY